MASSAGARADEDLLALMLSIVEELRAIDGVAPYRAAPIGGYQHACTMAWRGRRYC
jgi:hypothetical protein